MDEIRVDALVTSRPMRPDDAERLRRLFPRLSSETLYRRFFSPVRRIDERVLTHLVDVDHVDREAIVALVDDEIVGVARFDRLHDELATAEVAVVVEDAWQRRGVGGFLMRRLAARAADEGITRFTAEVLPSNQAPVQLARAVAPLVEVSFVDGETRLVIPLDPVRPSSRRRGSGPGSGSSSGHRDAGHPRALPA